MRTQDEIKAAEIRRYKDLVQEFRLDIAKRSAEITMKNGGEWEKRCLEASRDQVEVYEKILDAIMNLEV